jgi:hypothetical protein
MFYIVGLLAAVDLALFAVTAVMGVLLHGRESVSLHLLAGVLTALTCTFTHVLVLFYLIGTGKDIRDAVEEDPELAARFVPWTRLLKRRVFPWACAAITLTVVAALLGAEVHSRIIIEAHRRGVMEASAALPLREVAGWWSHLAVTVFAAAANVVAFQAELSVVRENRRGIAAVNLALAGHEEPSPHRHSG